LPSNSFEVKQKEYNHETDFSTAQQKKKKQTRLPQPDGNRQWTPGAGLP
jgi:hypothetical protein